MSRVLSDVIQDHNRERRFHYGLVCGFQLETVNFHLHKMTTNFSPNIRFDFTQEIHWWVEGIFGDAWMVSCTYEEPFRAEKQRL